MLKHRVLAAFCAIFLVFPLHTAVAQVAPATAASAIPVTAQRPKVALVLSGGGARGFAHLGVLRVLKEMHVPVDIVVGTSMGAVVGGAYAAGRSVEELEQLVRNTAWDAVLADRPARDDLAFRRREEDLLMPSHIEFAATARGFALPPAAAGNAALEVALTRLLPIAMRDRAVNQLALPFRSVASDLLSGELVELVDTPLFLTMRASLAVPGVFSPVRVNQRLVVDGGLVRNLPIDMAKAMGADVVIAVNVGTPLAQEEELGSAIGVAQQMLQILTEQNVQRSLKELGPHDILIAPDLKGISFLDFSSYERTILAGAAAARKLSPRLLQLALPAAQYAALEKERLAVPLTVAQANAAGNALPLAKVEIQGAHSINPEILIAQSGLHEGTSVTREQVRQAASRLYARGDLDNVETEISDYAGQRSVVIKPTESAWSRSRLRIGLELASDFSDNNSFSLGAMHIASSLNDRGGELLTIAKLGSNRLLGMQFWQPLAAGSQWYAAPSLEYGATAADLFNQGRKISRLGIKTTSATFSAGRQLSNWGDLQAGVSRRFGKYDVLIPEGQNVPSISFYDTTQFIQLKTDTLDSLAFPTRGNLLTARWERSPSQGPGAPSLARSAVAALSAFKADEWAGHLYGEWSKSQRGPAPSSLGGFLRLSGTTTESLEGNTIVLGRLVMARRIAAMPAALGGAIRIGFSAEMGGGFGVDERIRAGSLKQAASGFLSLDTKFGPLYLGAGATRGTGSTLYLFLGPIW
ncbi:MAG: patatin-like phospholipase family protein [Pseudomonadota bacterium]